VSFCAFWCDTWKGQTQRLDAARHALQGLPVDYLMIAVDGRWSEMARGKVRHTVLLDTGGSVTSRLGVNSVPYTLVIDGSGRVRFAAQGIVRTDVLLGSARTSFGRVAGQGARPVYLTFENFPTGAGGIDDELLDVLRRENVKATFFCSGAAIAANRGVVARAVREGHALQINGWTYHPGDAGTYRAARALQGVTGVKPTLRRPPGSTQILRLAGGALAAETTNPYDDTRPGSAELARRVLTATRPGHVVYLHAGVEATVSTLPQLIRSLRARGLTFGTLR
jgi:peptidoglycan/xylan/chitin deacetylase (PgdA/CDA1 family)